MNYRSRALLNLAHALNVCPECGRMSLEGLEPAHSNQHRHGKGMSIKAHDHWHAALCHDCHAQLDQGNGLSREQREALWERAFIKTWDTYFLKGWIVVKKGE